jgi:hypothetical protein
MNEKMRKAVKPDIPFSPEHMQRIAGTTRLDSITYTIYGDAAGIDSWGVHDGRCYVFGWATVRHSHRWKKYREMHATRGRGHIHMADRFPGGTRERDALGRDIFTLEPYDFAHVFIVDKKKYRENLIRRKGEPPHRSAIQEHLWGQLSVVAAAPVLLLDKMGGRQSRQSPIRGLVYNHPGEGAKSEARIRGHVGHIWGGAVHCEFRKGGDPGIDLADALCWSFYRVATGGTDRHLPWSSSEGFGKRLFVFLIDDESGSGKEIEPIRNLDDLKRKTVSLR